MRKIGLLFILFSMFSFSQTLLLEENFDYSASDMLTNNGWTAYSGEGNDPIVVESSSLTYSGYPSSGEGGSIIVDANGEDVYMSLSSEQTSGIVYVSLLVNISNATTSSDGDYFFGLASTGAGSLGGRLYLKKSGDNFAFGISKTTGTTTFTDFEYSFNTTYLVVIKYIINSGASNDDVALFIISGAISETEPTPTISQPTESTSDPSNISVVALRQNSTTNVVTIDGIRVATSWSQAPLPVELTLFSASVIKNHVHLIWITSTEISNYGFDVERKDNAGGFHKIGFVRGSGNSNSEKEYEFVDKSISLVGKYYYRLKQIDTDGSFSYSEIVEIDLASPLKYNLSQNYPNPFNPLTTINYAIPEATNVKIFVYNLLGELILTLVDEFKEAGNYSAVLNGDQLGCGTYFYKLQAEGFTEVRKMIVLK